MASQWTTIPVDGQNMWAYMSLPDGAGPHPGVVVIQHGPGLNNFIQDFTRRLAAEGYAAIAPNMYHRDDPTVQGETFFDKIGRLRDDTVIEDVNATIRHLSTLPMVRGDRIGITGFCFGGRVAYLMAAVNPVIRASGLFYPWHIMAPWGEGPSPLDRTPSLKNCQVVGFFGEDDQDPTVEEARKIDAELTRQGKSHEFHYYAGAPHGFMANTNPERYRPGAARDAWGKLLDTFQKHLCS